MSKDRINSLKSMMKAMSLQSQIAVLVIALHVLLLVGFQLSPQRVTTANSMGDLVVASLLDPNPQLEKKTTPAPKPEKKLEPKVEPKPVLQNNKIVSSAPAAPAASASPPLESASTVPPSSAGGSSTGELKSVSISQAQCSVPEPFYPSLARRMGESGKTMVRLMINESGTVDKVSLSQSSGIQRLDQAALDAAMKIRCRPFVESGKAIKVTAIQPYIFRLE
jgi:protein TonB